MEFFFLLLLKFIDVIKKQEGPLLIRKSMLLNKDQVETELGALRDTLREKFDDLENL